MKEPRIPACRRRRIFESEKRTEVSNPAVQFDNLAKKAWKNNAVLHKWLPLAVVSTMLLLKTTRRPPHAHVRPTAPHSPRSRINRVISDPFAGYVCLPPSSGARADISGPQLRARNGLMHCDTKAHFDHLVGAPKKRSRILRSNALAVSKLTISSIFVTSNHFISPAAKRRPSRKNARCFGTRQCSAPGMTEGVISRRRSMVARASSRRPKCAQQEARKR